MAKANMSNESTPMRFYVLRVLSNKEDEVLRYIEREKTLARGELADLSAYINRVLVPKEKYIDPRSSKKTEKERPITPGYVYVEAAMIPELVHRLRTIPNVVGFLGESTREGYVKPIPIRMREMNGLLARADRDAEGAGTFDVEYIVGETVRIIEGPFSDFSAIIDEVLSDKKKLKVMVKIFGRKTPLELGYAQVEKE